ncbi:MAG: cold shock domain-containing protein [Chloroflexota bacterium]
MPYRDTWATCEKCGKQFVFTVEQQRRLDKMGLEVEPGLCPDCQEEQVEKELEPLEEGEQRGVIKWYEPKKRYGFITMRSGDDIFFHRNAIAEGDEKEFAEGAPVTFGVTESDKGPEAEEVKLIK